MSDMLPLLRKRRAGENRDDAESKQHDLRLEQLHFVSPHRVAPVPFISSGFGVA
jgi:hypothetical protein